MTVFEVTVNCEELELVQELFRFVTDFRGLRAGC